MVSLHHLLLTFRKYWSAEVTIPPSPDFSLALFLVIHVLDKPRAWKSPLGSWWMKSEVLQHPCSARVPENSRCSKLAANSSAVTGGVPAPQASLDSEPGPQGTEKERCRHQAASRTSSAPLDVWWWSDLPELEPSWNDDEFSIFRLCHQEILAIAQDYHSKMALSDVNGIFFLYP